MKPPTHTRNSDSWPEENKLRLMCSNGGHIVPRPHDKSLCYIGGETRMVVVDRHITLPDLTRHLSKTLIRSSSPSPAKGFPFTIKYQLPSEDLDSLISVTTDEDLENMIEEYERLNPSSRLRLFIFPTNSESVCWIGSFLESSIKSEDWFVNALNGANLGFSDSLSVNWLLGLDDEISPPEKQNVNQKDAIGTIRGNNSGQDVNSISDSALMETSSSFGSASSPIGGSVASPVPEVFSGFDLASADSVVSDLTNANDRATDPNDSLDQNTRIQMQQQFENPACLLSMPTNQINSSRNQLHQHHAQLKPLLQYIPHRHPPGVVSVASYYQHQPHHPPIDQQNFVYYMPARPPPQVYNNQTILKNELQAGTCRTANAGVPHPVMVPSSGQNQPQYVGYSGIHQPSQLVYYATQAVPPLSGGAKHQKMASISPVEASLQEQYVRTAQP